MEQTIKHEWQGNVYRKICPHCGVVKERSNLDDPYTYKIPNRYPSNQEPKCITRKKSENGTDTAT